jgi:hypothetical protein
MKIIVLHSPSFGALICRSIITIHASAFKSVQCGNWLTTLAGDSQSLIHRINFETCETATPWSGLFVLDLGTIQVRFEAMIGSFLVQFPKMPRKRRTRDSTGDDD